MKETEINFNENIYDEIKNLNATSRSSLEIIFFFTGSEIISWFIRNILQTGSNPIELTSVSSYP